MRMHRTAIRLLAAAGTIAFAATASAQLLSSASLERSTIKAGEAAKLTAQLEVTSGTNCGLRVHWGDGSTQDFKINQAKDVPLVASHTYAKPGSYTVKVEPKSQGMTMMKCGGRNQETALTVTAATPAKAAAKPKAKASAPAKAASAARKP
jgi:hypothetical protein